jgi:hypothetical protein
MYDERYGHVTRVPVTRDYSVCPTCGKTVRINKWLIGATHFCLTACEVYGHLQLQIRRRGPFWNRRTEEHCAIDHVVTRTWPKGDKSAPKKVKKRARR